MLCTSHEKQGLGWSLFLTLWNMTSVPSGRSPSLTKAEHCYRVLFLLIEKNKINVLTSDFIKTQFCVRLWCLSVPLISPNNSGPLLWKWRGEKKTRERELQGYRNWCHGLWNEFSFQHLFRMNCSHTIWAKKPTEIVMPDQIICLLQNLRWILLFLSGADILEIGRGEMFRFSHYIYE